MEKYVCQAFEHKHAMIAALEIAILVSPSWGDSGAERLVNIQSKQSHIDVTTAVPSLPSGPSCCQALGSEYQVCTATPAYKTSGCCPKHSLFSLSLTSRHPISFQQIQCFVAQTCPQVTRRLAVRGSAALEKNYSILSTIKLVRKSKRYRRNSSIPSYATHTSKLSTSSTRLGNSLICSTPTIDMTKSTRRPQMRSGVVSQKATDLNHLRRRGKGTWSSGMSTAGTTFG